MTEEKKFEIVLDAPEADDDAMVDVEAPRAEAPSTEVITTSATTEVNERDEETLKKLRLDALHIQGVDNLSSEQVRRYIRLVTKVRRFTLEWVNDTSVNINFLSPDMTLEALRQLAVSPPVPDPQAAAAAAVVAANGGPPIPVPPPPPVVDAQGNPLDDDILRQQEAEYENLVHSVALVAAFVNHAYDLEATIKDGSASNVAQFFLQERETVPFPVDTAPTVIKEEFEDPQQQQQQEPIADSNESSKSIFIVRYAMDSDVKVRGSRQMSRYYLVHGEPSVEDDLITFGSIRNFDRDEQQRREDEKRKLEMTETVQALGEEVDANNGEILPSRVLRRLEGRGSRGAGSELDDVTQEAFNEGSDSLQGRKQEMDEISASTDRRGDSNSLFGRIGRSHGSDRHSRHYRSHRSRSPDRREGSRSRSRSRSPGFGGSRGGGRGGDRWRYDGQRRGDNERSYGRGRDDSRWRNSRRDSDLRGSSTGKDNRWKHDLGYDSEPKRVGGVWEHDLHDDVSTSATKAGTAFGERLSFGASETDSGAGRRRPRRRAHDHY
ncbi:uncharacterized protein SAPINGB_P003141 [Magnusiomyces paraingens]|uniref:Uncharacterized protein n=1 Tax=Magnusiomyces paraingens TaxID=2606893 RepID=A0A5E8BS58_9ASCO|nr:uncharacterized protein SAPINGB_P003141 [Saprochaete ingens]VVT51573.1 unnamed protein product [Saprochaete ingens]